MSFASIGVGGALAISSAAGLAGSLASGAMQAGAAKDGQKAAQKASLWGWNEGGPYYDAAQNYMAPYTQLSNDAIWQLENWLGNKGSVNAASNAFWQPPNMRQAAQDAGLDYNAIVNPIGPDQLQALLGYTPKQAYAPITRTDLRDFTGIGVKKSLKGYTPADTQRLAGVDLKGLFNSVGNIGINNPKPRKQPQQMAGGTNTPNRVNSPGTAQGAGLKPAQQKNFQKLQGLAQQGKLNDTQQANYLRLLGMMMG